MRSLHREPLHPPFKEVEGIVAQTCDIVGWWLRDLGGGGACGCGSLRSGDPRAKTRLEDPDNASRNPPPNTTAECGLYLYSLLSHETIESIATML